MQITQTTTNESGLPSDTAAGVELAAHLMGVVKAMKALGLSRKDAEQHAGRALSIVWGRD